MHVHGATHGPRLVISLVVTLAFVVAETIASVAGSSLALLSDAGHNASDALALGLAAYAIWVSKKPANEKNTYGYHRVSILTALFNAVSLILIAVLIFVEAMERFSKPQPVAGNLMMAVAAVSVLMNTVIAWLLAGGAKHSLNMRAAFVHMLGDALSAVAVVAAGFIVKRTGWTYADPTVSVLIALFILYTAWGIVRESVTILLEATPKDLNIENMVSAMSKVPSVLSVHDVHAWSVSDGMNYLSCHVVVPSTCTMDQIGEVIRNINELLSTRFQIAHATIQAETEGSCDHREHPDSRFCSPRVAP